MKFKIFVEETQSIPQVLFHATYKPLLASIKLNGLGGKGSEKKRWEDSIAGKVYLARSKDVAESYAESSDTVPDSWLDQIVILKIQTSRLDKNKFTLDKNVKDNDGSTLEYDGIIPSSEIDEI